MTPMEQLKAMVAGKKVAFIGAGVSHKPCITMLAALGADITLCDQKKSWMILVITPIRCAS